MGDNIQMVLVLGAGRSGTKFLRDLLGESHDIAIVPYDVGYVWRYGNESWPDDELPISSANSFVVRYIRKVLPTLIRNSDKKKDFRFIVEKSVPNTLRPEFVTKCFPEAKVIHLVRDGRAVVESSLRLWKAPAERSYLLKKLKYFPWTNYRYAFWYLSNMIRGVQSGRGQRTWGPRYASLETDSRSESLITLCARQWKHCVEKPLDFFGQENTEKYRMVRYENLLSDKNTILEICDFIGISDADRIVRVYEDRVDKSNEDKWRSRFSKAEINILREEIGSCLSRLDYN